MADTAHLMQDSEKIKSLHFHMTLSVVHITKNTTNFYGVEIQQNIYMKSRLIHLHVSLATLASVCVWRRGR